MADIEGDASDVASAGSEGRDGAPGQGEAAVEALGLIYGGWEAYQEQLAQAIAPLTDEQLELRAAPHLRSVGEQLRHLIAVRAGWIHGDLGEGGPEYDDILTWYERDVPQPSADALREGLGRTWQLIRESLVRWTPGDLTETVTSHWTEPGEEPEQLVRGWVLYHVLEHDLHHGGELGFLLGMHGLPAPNI